jgi:hypothetical protein
MLSKKKLEKVEAILQSYLTRFENQKDGKHNTSTVPLAYASGLNLLIKNDAFNQIVNKQNRIKNAKIVRAAKTLIPQFEDFGVESYTQLTTKVLSAIKDLNGDSKLAPHTAASITCLNDKLIDYELECSAFYTNLLVDIFNTGRQHQTVANPNAQVTFKKFASFGQVENESFDTITAHLKNELFVYLDYLKTKLVADIERCAARNNSKSEMLNYLNKKFSRHSYTIQDIFRKHCWQVYSFGNIYQLEKDNVRQVTWQTGHHIDDCLTCRAFQTGEAILKDENGNELPYSKVNEAVIYNINDIIKIAKLDGPAFFCHPDCRCEFISE